jgi:hypothetical protein
MGQSTNAILSWGIQFEDGEGAPWAEKAEEAGFDPWSDDYLAFALCDIKPFNGPEDDWGERGSPEYEAISARYSAYYDKKEVALAGLGVEFLHHCSGDYPMYMLVISGSEQSASRGYPESINPREMEMAVENGNWPQTLRAVMEKLEIDGDKDMGWTLCSYWG